MKKKRLSILLILTIIFSMSISNPLAVYADPVPYSGITVSSEHSFPVNVVIGPDNYLYVAEYSGNKIMKMDKNGQDKTTFATGFNQPIGMVFDAAGNLYVAEHAGSKVTKVDSSGNTSLVRSFGSGSFLTGIVIDSHSKIFTVDYTQGKIYKMDLNGDNSSTFAMGLSTNSVIGMTIDSNDNIYVSDRAGLKALKMTPDGTVTDFVTGLSVATWISLGEDGYFYASTGSRTIEKIDADGTKLRSFSTGTVSPWGLSVDENGYIYFGESSSTIRKIVGSASTSSPTSVAVTLNLEISGVQADPAAFAFAGIASNPQVTAAVISDSSLLLTLSAGISANDTNIKLSYAKTGTNDLLVSGTASEFEAFSDLPVSNNVRNVTSVDAIPQINVTSGTPLGEVALPGTATLKLSNSTSVTAPVSWDGGTPAYNGSAAGTYAFTGALDLTGLGSIANPNNLTALASVIVQEGSSSSSNSSHTPPAPVTRIDNGGSITGSNLDQLISVGKTLTVEGDKGAKIVFDKKALKGIDEQTSGKIKVEMKDVSLEHQDTHPGKLVFSLIISSGSGTISNFGGSATISLPYTLKEGESEGDVNTWYLAGDGTMTQIPCTYDQATGLATFSVKHFSLYLVGTNLQEISFSDVDATDWFYDAVQYVYKNNLMQGTGSSEFSPKAITTRGMIVTTLWRMESKPSVAATEYFADVAEGAYYTDAVKWASTNGIVTGYASKFKPDSAVTREQLATMLYRYAKYKGYDVNAQDNLSLFKDSPSDWSLESMQWAVSNGLMQGC